MSSDEQRLPEEATEKQGEDQEQEQDSVDQATLVSTIAALQAEVGRLRRTQERASRKPKNFNILREFERIEQLQNSVEAAIAAPTPGRARNAASRQFATMLERLIVIDRAGPCDY